MRKSILRFGALALMSLMSISVWADRLPAGTVFMAQNNQGQYTVNKDGNVTLTKAVTGLSKVPAKVSDQSSNEYSVTAIGTKAFWNDPVAPATTGAYIVNQVEVNASVTSVANEAFKGVETITINLSNLAYIGENAFNNGTTTDGSGNTIYKTTFIDPGTTSAPVELKAQTIGNGAFAGTNLAVVVWDGGQDIPERCFSGCTALEYFVFKKFDINSYYKNIGADAFKGAKSLKYFGWTTNAISATAPYYLPVGLNTIGASAFEGCINLTGFNILAGYNPSIQTVEQFAFKDCKNLTNEDFKIFANASMFKSGAFMLDVNKYVDDGKLNKVTLPAEVQFENVPVNSGTNESPITTYYGVFEGRTGLSEVIFPASLSSLGKNAFKGCTSLATLTGFVGTSLTEIPEGAFSGCTALTTNYDSSVPKDNVNDCFGFPANVTTIGANAFYGCTGIKPIILPNKLQTIGASAFENSKFIEVTFPAGVTKIGDKAFYGNTDLATINIIGQGANAEEHKTPERITCVGEDVFSSSTYSNATLNVPYGCLAKYTDQSNYTPTGGSLTYNNQSWHKFDTSKVKSAPSEYVTGNTFWVGGLCYKVTGYDANGVATVSVVDGLYVANTLKNYNANLYQDNIKDQETHKDWVGAKVLGTDITIPQYVVTRYDKSKNNNVFYKVTGFEALNTAALAKAKKNPATDFELTGEGNAVAKVTSVTIDAEGLPVPASAFKVTEYGNNKIKAGFTGLTTFSAPKKISSLGESAFEGCENLELARLDVTGTFNEISANAFKGCIKISEFTIPSNVVTIGAGAFDGTSLTSIIIPKAVRTIGANAFTYTYNPQNDEETGVKNVYVEWLAEDFTGTNPLKFLAAESTETSGIKFDAFGTEQVEEAGGIIYYHRRNLHYPTGVSAKYSGEGAPAIFKSASHLFQTLQGIKVNGVNKYMEIDEEDGLPAITLVDVLDEDRATTSVEIGEAMNNVHVTYSRDFDSNKWQCWFVPFDYTYTVTSPATFAYLYDTELDESGNTKFEYKPVEFNKYGEAKIKANVPYLVKPKNIDKGVEFFANNLAKTQPTNLTVADAKSQYTFSGVYTKKEYKKTDAKKWYGLYAETGVFRPAEDGAYINAYRFYMTVTDGDNPYGLVKIVVLDDEDATGISDINAESLSAPMYDVTGRQIVSPVKGQVYIQNGVKKLAK